MMIFHSYVNVYQSVPILIYEQFVPMFLDDYISIFGG